MQGKPTRHSNVYRQDDGRLFVRVTARVNGKRVDRIKALPAGATETDAIKLVVEIKEALEKAGLPEAATSPLDLKSGALPTFADYVEQWVKAKKAKVRAAVIHEWAHRLAVHVLPVKVLDVEFGTLRLDQIRRMHVESWVAWAQKATQSSGKNYSPDTVAGWWRVLKAALMDASADYDLPDPIRRIDAPDLSHVERVRTQDTITVEQVTELVEKARTFVPERADEVAFLAWTGCRSGEMYGLHWADVDLDGGVAVLRHSATRGLLEHTKTGSARNVPLVPPLVETLREHRKLQTQGEVPQSKDGLVFPNEKGGFRLEQSLAKPFDALSAALGQKVTPQVLRRSLNTNLIAAGVDQFTIQAILGHTSAAMTARYAGISVDRKAGALGALCASVTPAGQTDGRQVTPGSDRGHTGLVTPAGGQVTPGRTVVTPVRRPGRR
jgi:integrase